MLRVDGRLDSVRRQWLQSVAHAADAATVHRMRWILACGGDGAKGEAEFEMLLVGVVSERLLYQFDRRLVVLSRDQDDEQPRRSRLLTSQGRPQHTISTPAARPSASTMSRTSFS